MTATAQDVRNVDWTNSFELISDGQIDCVIADEVPCYLNEIQWGTCATKGQALVAAHIITLGLRGGTSAAGPVTAESAGGVSRSYASATISGTDAFWQSTTFGQRYLAMAKMRLSSPMVLVADGVIVDGALVL